ncbi:hypothetical protein F9288_13230 [Sphingomonas sp. CL5.1]|uniref:hypothetical protein n=1 Tax=Sphingomonas sp. CL5.1 TaxID=2653203 RepID=UPI0015838CD9|nr:hypothetical protein [Sphingomonas sp. CL5.1]QKS00473.1 hypothetical protein F9288_13230 [Sphingomonas sp. CL5.1]
MAQPSDFRAQAVRCRAEAEAATLHNVRERCLRAEAAWLEMAQRHERVASARAARELRPGIAGGDPLQEPA